MRDSAGRDPHPVAAVATRGVAPSLVPVLGLLVAGWPLGDAAWVLFVEALLGVLTGTLALFLVWSEASVSQATAVVGEVGLWVPSGLLGSGILLGSLAAGIGTAPALVDPVGVAVAVAGVVVGHAALVLSAARDTDRALDDGTLLWFLRSTYVPHVVGLFLVSVLAMEGYGLRVGLASLFGLRLLVQSGTALDAATDERWFRPQP